ncbi:hypothetical protein cypCar_00017958 [Cyprinus carpio]|nr:hypothetical protein cypCar_00017958 [Cyprinus carpio]
MNITHISILLTDVRFPKESTEDIQKQQLKYTAFFLISNQIPAFTKSCLDHTSMPTDGVTLTEALHQHSINILYLGTVLEYTEKISQKERPDHVYVTKAQKYHYSLPCGSVEEAVNKCRLQRITLLREIAIKTGIQVYQFVLDMI